MRVQLKKEGSDLIYNPRATTTNSDFRSTYTAKSPFRENFKKDILVKNHQKCIDVLSLAISLAAYEQSSALALAYMILRAVDRDLATILDSLKK